MWRKAAAASLVLAPIALAIATGVDPALGDDQGYGIYRAHPDATQWHSLLLHWAWVLFVPGLLGLLGPVRKRGAVLAAVAWVSVMIGLATFAALMAVDFALLAREQHGLTDAQLTAVDDQFGELGWATWGWQVPGLAGWALSLIVTPLAAARARVISWWVAGAVLAGTVLYLLFAISPVPLSLTGPVVLVVAYGIAAKQLLAGGPDRTAEPDTFGALRRRFGLVCLVAAPVSFAVGMATVPPGDDIVGHPGLTQASGFFLHLAWVLFVPAVLAIAGRAGRVTRVIAGVTVLGLLNFSGLMVGDYVDLANRQVLGAADADRLSEIMGGYVLFTAGWALPGMALALVGLVAVAISAGVERVLRWWVPALVVAGMAAFLLLGIGPLGVVGPVLLIGGFGAAAMALRRTPAEVPVPAEPVRSR
ncbi:hypothetical protein [Paractinoplanes rishiriensis]|uniref:Uncharacterized protein n=1 Tax=Paractinoplanes rishiriensis TaxID=1050105 RepID=A0A919JWQ9_9ACTN|nr:hypothetical protein [Actinoplanes rishiriensis]GIE96616.1 hypothetical protein Ari01nite_40810 [Actinoplanes rishiriensis]